MVMRDLVLEIFEVWGMRKRLKRPLILLMGVLTLNRCWRPEVEVLRILKYFWGTERGIFGYVFNPRITRKLNSKGILMGDCGGGYSRQ